jgi:hypothetical protein
MVQKIGASEENAEIVLKRTPNDCFQTSIYTMAGGTLDKA